MKIVLISCVGKKKNRKCEAKELYDSTWFRLAFRYACSLQPDKIFILSAKFGLVDQHALIDPYNDTLRTKSDQDIQAWSDRVLKALEKQANLAKDMFIILAGENYRRHLAGRLVNSRVPMKGLRIGEQLKWLKSQIPA